jgi:diphthamide biosynthesis protein 7
VTSAETSVVG